MTKDEQARALLVEIALHTAERPDIQPLANTESVRRRAGFRDPSKGSWCAAGLTAGMEDAGLVVPAPGTPARRGAVALLDFVSTKARETVDTKFALPSTFTCKPGDIIAWLQNTAPEEWRQYGNVLHAFAASAAKSMCDLRRRENGVLAIPDHRTKKCSACVWETRKGHVATIVAVDDESITTVGWNEGAAPGRVMKRRLWRDPNRPCQRCRGWRTGHADCPLCHGRMAVSRSSTVLHRKPNGLLYGIARPVAA